MGFHLCLNNHINFVNKAKQVLYHELRNWFWNSERKQKNNHPSMSLQEIDVKIGPHPTPLMGSNIIVSLKYVTHDNTKNYYYYILKLFITRTNSSLSCSSSSLQKRNSKKVTHTNLHQFGSYFLLTFATYCLSWPTQLWFQLNLLFCVNGHCLGYIIN